MLARQHFLSFQTAISFQPQGTNHRRQREALYHQRRQNDSEADQDDFGPEGKRRTRGSHDREGQGGRERDNAAHSGPSDQKDVRPGRKRSASPKRGTQPSGNEGGERNPP